MRGERIDLSRIPLDDERGLRDDPAGGDDGGVPDREQGPDADAAPQPPGEPRRPHRAGGAGAPGPDPGRRRASVPRAPQAPARGSLVTRFPTTHPSLEPILERHAGRDRVPGPGDPGRDGAGGVQPRRGGGPAPGDEQEALGGGAARLPGALHRGGGGARGRRGGRGAGVRGDPGLLGIRVSEVARRRLRAAGLPVDVAAGPLRPRVPVLAAQRAADGLLPARRARPRGAAAGDRGAGAGREPQRVDCSVRGRARSGSGSGTSPGCARRTPRRWSRSASAAARIATPPTSPRARGRPRRAGAAGLGGARASRWPARAAPRCGGSAWRRARGDAARRAACPARAAAAVPAAPSLREQTPWEQVVADYASIGIALESHPMALLREELGDSVRLERGYEAGSGRRVGRGGGDGGRAPAAGDGTRRRVHAARGRAGDRQRDRPSAGLRAPQADRAHGVVRARSRARWSGARGR